MKLDKGDGSHKRLSTRETIGLISGILGIITFLGVTNIWSVIDVFRGTGPDLAPAPDTVIVTEVPKPIIKNDTQTTDAGQLEDNAIEPESYQPDKKANGYYIEISNDTLNTVSIPNKENVINLTEKKPSDGYGKVIFRNICSYCQWVNVLMPESAGGIQEINLPRFDSFQKWETSKSGEYLPGIYRKVLFQYGPHDTVYRDIIVKEGKTIVYYFNKQNPFKEGCGRVAFISLHSSRKYNVSLTQYNREPIKGYGQTYGVTKNGTSLPFDSNGQVLLSEFKKSVLYFDLPTNRYRYTASDPLGRIEDPNRSNITNTIRVFEGYLEVIYLD